MRAPLAVKLQTLNNLLTVIGGRAGGVLAGLPPDDRKRRDVELILETTDRAAALTRQLVAFSRKQVLQPRVLDLNELVSGIVPMLQRLIGEHVTLETRAGRDLGLVRADPTQIEQVILNLVVNARDAMPGGGVLSIETANAKPGERIGSDETIGRGVKLVVHDSGIGMSPQTQAHLFEPFFTTKEPGKGTGLGLATVYGIVNQSGGYVTIDRFETSLATSWRATDTRCSWQRMEKMPCGWSRRPDGRRISC